LIDTSWMFGALGTYAILYWYMLISLFKICNILLRPAGHMSRPFCWSTRCLMPQGPCYVSLTVAMYVFLNVSFAVPQGSFGT
jgi:hypothetical protein